MLAILPILRSNEMLTIHVISTLFNVDKTHAFTDAAQALEWCKTLIDNGIEFRVSYITGA